MTPLYRPTRDDLATAMRLLLPQGEIWQSDDLSIRRLGSKLLQLLWGIAGPFNAAELAIADLYLECFVSTASDDLDLWREEYGLPDDCDPWGDDVVAKATTLGGTSIEYYEALAAKLGWSASMRWLKGSDPDYPGITATLLVSINTAASPAYDAGLVLTRWALPTGRLGEADGARLVCALDGVIPAHCDILYTII